MIKEFLNNFYWDCNESFDVFVNKKNEIVGIVDMYSEHPIKYFFMKLFYKRTDNFRATKNDYVRLYPKEIENILFHEDEPKYKYNKKHTLGYAITH